MITSQFYISPPQYMLCNNKFFWASLLYREYKLSFLYRGRWRHCRRRGLSCGFWMLHGEPAAWVWGHLVMLCLAKHTKLFLLSWMPGTPGLLSHLGPAWFSLVTLSPTTQGHLPRSPYTVVLTTEIFHALVLLLDPFPIPLECLCFQTKATACPTPPVPKGWQLVPLIPLHIHTLSYMWRLACN